MSRGQIQLIFGPMFSGKTGELFRRLRRYTVAKKKCLLIKYSRDTRYSVEQASTHDQQQLHATPCERLSEISQQALDADVIGIDEGQFFPDIVEFSESMANEGKVVIVGCLDGTFQRKPFGRVLELVPLAEHLTKLTSVCMICQSEAAFSKRLGSEMDIEVIGGADKYIAVCRQCYMHDSSSSPSLPLPLPNPLSASLAASLAHVSPPSTSSSPSHSPACSPPSSPTLGALSTPSTMLLDESGIESGNESGSESSGSEVEIKMAERGGRGTRTGSQGENEDSDIEFQTVKRNSPQRLSQPVDSTSFGRAS
eukprot:TRINITY_DN3421_c0_g1_i3.p1 TRINITY_DN3421_c0_g1~~TRINITY_DN3421_c0_g1_i3.p1  ORF type:complete len:310 (+),score=85.02 TRINITY_DN3421_c0_g1_i3:138-1067(+)